MDTREINAIQLESVSITDQKNEPAQCAHDDTSNLEPYQHMILELLKQQELLMASIYQKLAILFPDNADSYHTFLAEEMEHAGWIEQLHKACLSGKARFSEGKTRSYTISNMINYVQEFYKRLEVGQLTELQAVTAVASFENALIERNVFQRFSGDTTEVKNVLSLLDDNQKKHTQRIAVLLNQVRTLPRTTYE
ncbi:MAG: hypothetical protein HGB32_09965 [Geobacteraceae bacterium]|nr:hypothetical protein [Geobacteraceae bacterium]NTW80459.1 hypothetical protein [Geobacteraceae bacterium]